MGIKFLIFLKNAAHSISYEDIIYKASSMNSFKIVLFVTIFLTISVTPKELVKFTLSSYILPDKSLSMELSVVTPRTPGEYPVILFMTGLEGVIPAVFQEKLIESVAEQGFIWMTVRNRSYRYQDCKVQILRK